MINTVTLYPIIKSIKSELIDVLYISYKYKPDSVFFLDLNSGNSKA